MSQDFFAGLTRSSILYTSAQPHPVQRIYALASTQLAVRQWQTYALLSPLASLLLLLGGLRPLHREGFPAMALLSLDHGMWPPWVLPSLSYSSASAPERTGAFLTLPGFCWALWP